VILGVFRKVAQRRRLADAVLDVDLRLVKIFAFLIERRFSSELTICMTITPAGWVKKT